MERNLNYGINQVILRFFKIQLYLISINFNIFFLVSKAALVVPGAAESLQQRRRSFGTELEDSIAAFRNKNASDEAKL